MYMEHSHRLWVYYAHYTRSRDAFAYCDMCGGGCEVRMGNISLAIVNAVSKAVGGLMTVNGLLISEYMESGTDHGYKIL